MKSTLADNKQMFNVKDIAYATTAENLAEGQFGIFAEGSDTSIPATVVTFDALPEKFNMISKVGGKTYFSFDTIEKSKIKNIVQKDYTAEVVNEWKTTITYCECAKGFQINIGIDEQSLIQRDGLTWTHNDFVVGFAAEEIDCQCNDGVLSGRDNNILTKLAVEKINGLNSPFYEASAETVGGAPIPDLDAFIATNKAVNEDSDDSNDVLMVLVVKGKPQPAPNYADIDVNYVYPRGVRLSPSLSLNDGDKSIAFEEAVALGFEVGAGYDLRAEEWENMNYYTDLNHYTRLSDGINAAGLKYQFENGVNYDTLTFEFYTDKVESNNGDKRLFGVLLAAVADSDESSELEDMFTA